MDAVEAANWNETQRLKVRAFKVTVRVVPSMVEVSLGIAKPEGHMEEREIWGLTLADAMRRANIT